jgi:hypothetical protein
MQFGFSKNSERASTTHRKGENKMMMKKQAATLLILTLVGLAGLVNAQTPARITAQVPFDFVVNGNTMPAGECTIAVDVNGRTLLSISSGLQHAYAFPIADRSTNAGKKTALVFHHYGNRYFLASTKREGGTGYQLPASKLERELLARNIPWQVFTLLASAK